MREIEAFAEYDPASNPSEYHRDQHCQQFCRVPVFLIAAFVGRIERGTQNRIELPEDVDLILRHVLAGGRFLGERFQLLGIDTCNFRQRPRAIRREPKMDDRFGGRLLVRLGYSVDPICLQRPQNLDSAVGWRTTVERREKWLERLLDVTEPEI